MKNLLKERLKKLLLDDIQEDLGVAQHGLESDFFWKNHELEKAADKLILLSRRIFSEDLSKRSGGLFSCMSRKKEKETSRK